ncbi:MAG TPA: tetratricopeptide repeat protein [Methanospirillum sp.]|nr:tetratricopeptide repeat protein [Methanospirillum sp.]
MEKCEKDLLMLRAVAHAQRQEFDKSLSCIDLILNQDSYDPLTLFNRAYTLRLAGKNEEAAEGFTSVLQVDPNSASAFFQLGLIESENGNMHRALAHFIDATDRMPLSSEAWYEQGLILSRMGRYREAKEIFSKGSVFGPDDDRFWDQIGLCYQKSGDYGEAIRAFDNALELKPSAEVILYHKARACEEMGRRDDEIACYDEIIRANPESIFPWLKKGLSLLLDEQYEPAIRSFSIATRLENPGHLPFLLKGLTLSILEEFETAISCFGMAYQISPDVPEISFHQGRALLSAGRSEEALCAFERVISLKPDNTEALEGKARALYQLERWDELCLLCGQARVLEPNNMVWYLLEARTRGWHTNEPDTALALIEEGLQNIGQDETLTILLADLLIKTEKRDEATAILLKGIDSVPDSIPYLFRLATQYTEMGEYQESIRILNHLHHLKPEDGQILFLAGQAHEGNGEFESALDQYTHGTTLDPLHPALWLGRARMQIELGDGDQAILSAQSAVSLSDDWYEAWIVKGKAEQLAEAPDEARKSFTRASVIQPDDPDAWTYLGELLLDQGENEIASISFLHALEADPTHTAAIAGRISALINIRDPTSALALYDQTIKGHEGLFSSVLGKAIILIRLGLIEKAITILQECDLLAGDDPGALFALADAWSMVNNFAHADILFDKGLQEDTENSEMWLMRAENLVQMNRTHDALACCERVLQIYPDDERAIEMRETCERILLGTREMDDTALRVNYDPLCKGSQ